MKSKVVKKKSFVIDSGALKQDVLVCINMRGAEINKVMNRYEDSEPLSQDSIDCLEAKKPGTALFLFNKRSNHRIITLFPRDNAELITLFDHEKMHALYHIMREVGIKLNSKTEEIFAYTSEHMMCQFLKKA